MRVVPVALAVFPCVVSDVVETLVEGPLAYPQRLGHWDEGHALQGEPERQSGQDYGVEWGIGDSEVLYVATLDETAEEGRRWVERDGNLEYGNRAHRWEC